MEKIKKYLQLFWAFFKIGLFTFGGGYAMISIISNEIVEKRKYITAVEFADIIAVAESTPGPIAINSATFIGYRRGGVLGSLIASLAVALPSFIIIFVISLFLDEFMKFELVQKAFTGIQCAVAVLIISAAFKLSKVMEKNAFSFILLSLAAAAMLVIDIFSLKISTAFLILAGAICGIIASFIPKKNGEKPTDSPTFEENEGEEEVEK